MQGKVSYIDFSEDFRGIQTSIRIFENETHIFIYVNQQHNEIHLYNDILRKIISKTSKRANKKKIETICNLKNYECIEDIGREISKIVDGSINS